MAYKYLNRSGLSYYHQKVKSLIKQVNSVSLETDITEGVGWYRIAEFACDSEEEAKGSTANSCEVLIRRGLGEQDPEFHHMSLMGDFGSSRFAELASISTSTEAHLIQQIRHTVDVTNMKAYIEIYYNSDSVNPIRTSIRVDDSLAERWLATAPVKTEETVEGVDIYSTHEVAENSIQFQELVDTAVIAPGDLLETDVPGEYVKYVMGSELADIIAPWYDETSTYNIGDYCTYDNKLYQCNENITTPEEFNVNKWRLATFAEELLTFAKRSIYSDTTVNLGRKSGSDVGKHSVSLGGNNIEATGDYSFGAGNDNIALEGQFVFGHFNNTITGTKNSTSGVSTGSILVVGNGTASQRSNAFRISGEGATIAKQAYSTTGADYAEFYEWADGNPDTEDRRGLFVTTVGNKIKIANADDDYILGAVSALPSVIGNYDEEWMGRYILDEFGAFVTEKYEYEEEIIDEVTGEVTVVTKTGTRWKENPDYNPNQPYIPREQRPEWSLVGLIGTLSVRDDGTCQVDGFCKVSDGGIATTNPTGYRVVQRVSDNIIKITFKGDSVNQLDGMFFEAGPMISE